MLSIINIISFHWFHCLQLCFYVLWYITHYKKSIKVLHMSHIWRFSHRWGGELVHRLARAAARASQCRTSQCHRNPVVPRYATLCHPVVPSGCTMFQTFRRLEESTWCGCHLPQTQSTTTGICPGHKMLLESNGITSNDLQTRLQKKTTPVNYFPERLHRSTVERPCKLKRAWILACFLSCFYQEMVRSWLRLCLPILTSFIVWVSWFILFPPAGLLRKLRFPLVLFPFCGRFEVLDNNYGSAEDTCEAEDLSRKTFSRFLNSLNIS